MAKIPRTADLNLFRPIILTSVVCKVLEAILKEKDPWPFVPIFIIDVATARLPPPTLNPDQPPRGRRIDYKMARRKDLINLDFFKAFDSVSHRLLPDKLRGCDPL